MKFRNYLLFALSLFSAGFTTFMLKKLLLTVLIGGMKLAVIAMMPLVLIMFESQLLEFLLSCVFAPFAPAFIIGLIAGAITMASILFVKNNYKTIYNWFENAEPSRLIIASIVLAMGLVAGAFLLSFGVGLMFGFPLISIAMAPSSQVTVFVALYLIGIAAFGAVSGVFVGSKATYWMHKPFLYQSTTPNELTVKHEVKSSHAYGEKSNLSLETENPEYIGLFTQPTPGLGNPPSSSSPSPRF